jgi:hypothetical protein
VKIHHGLKDLVTKEKANFQAAVEEGEGSQTSKKGKRAWDGDVQPW